MEKESHRIKRQISRLTFAQIICGVATTLGVISIVFSTSWPTGAVQASIMSSLGSGLFATGFISILIDIIWSKERTRMDNEQLDPICSNLNEVTERLQKLEGRLEAFKQLGFNKCYSERSKALESFYNYAKDVISSNRPSNTEYDRFQINIVSSSARGLVGYFDRKDNYQQKSWRNLITKYPSDFRLLLTHPSFAHLRQPAEERDSGAIELEILKTLIYLHCVAGMKSDNLRLYRGSPTVFTIQAGRNILLNPYPYGKMAMDTLCLEFESNNENSYVSNFVQRHFDHTWAFLEQDSKKVDKKALVVGIDTFNDILTSVSECTLLGDSSKLRLTSDQIKELDTFTSNTLPKNFSQFQIDPPNSSPFKLHIEKYQFKCIDE